jgi:hypothetical protein
MGRNTVVNFDFLRPISLLLHPKLLILTTTARSLEVTFMLKEPKPLKSKKKKYETQKIGAHSTTKKEGFLVLPLPLLQR